MAKKKEPEKQGNEELFLALDLLEKEKGIPAEYMLDKIKKAISTACKNNYGNEDVDIDVDREKGVFNVYLRKEIVEEVEDPNRQYLLDKAKQVDPTACVGRFVRIKLDTKQFGRVAAQTARNIIRQGIRDSERGQMMEEFQSKHQELVSGLVERIDPRTGPALPAAGQGRGRAAEKRADRRGECEGGRLHKGICGRCARNREGPQGHYLPHPPRPGEAHV